MKKENGVQIINVHLFSKKNKTKKDNNHTTTNAKTISKDKNLKQNCYIALFIINLKSIMNIYLINYLNTSRRLFRFNTLILRIYSK